MPEMCAPLGGRGGAVCGSGFGFAAGEGWFWFVFLQAIVFVVVFAAGVFVVGKSLQRFSDPPSWRFSGGGGLTGELRWRGRRSGQCPCGAAWCGRLRVGREARGVSPR